jgi:iron complex outermembrane receptor protein
MAVSKTTLVGSASCIAILAAASPVFAQSTTAVGAAAATSAEAGTVIVTGIRQSLQKAIQIKRTTIDQVDAISSTDIGKLPDKNAADSLQRLPGVNTSSAASGEGGFDENDRVSIRGTSPSLTQLTVDGHAIATGDWFILDQFQTVGRSVSFTLLPSELVQTEEVYKTQDASLLEGGVAGVVDLITHKPLDFGQSFTVQASAEGAYNSLTKTTKPQFDGLVAWHTADNTFGILAQGFYEDRSVERFGQETLGYESITAAMPIGAAHPELIGVQAPTLIGSTLFQQEKTREGGAFDIQWRPSGRAEFNLSAFYSHLDATNHNDNYMYWGSHELANNAPTSFTVANNTLTSAVWPAGTEGLIVDNIIRPHAFAYTYFVNLDGQYQVSDHFTVKGQAGFTEGLGETPQSPFFEADGDTAGISYSRSGNGWTVMPVGINPQSPNGLNNDFAINETFRSHDREIYGKLDGEYEFGGDGVFKAVEFGARAAEHTRRVDGWDRGCTLGANGACFSGGLFPFAATNPTSYPSGFNSGALGVPGLLIPIAGNPGTITNIINAIPGGVRGPISAIKQPLNYYWPGSFKVTEDDYAAYVMARVGGERWRGNFGVRLVETDENAFVNVSDPTGTHAGDIKTSAFGPYFVNHVKNNYFDVLPSVNFTFDLVPNVWLLRVSAAETLSRPDYSALGATVSLNDLTLSGNGGNANLRPVKAAVYDAALEWYYGPSSIAAVSVFYDDLSSYVTFGTSTQVFQNQFLSKTGPVFSPFVISSPVNTSGTVKGIELQVQQPVGGGFGFQANFTYVDGRDVNGQPLVGTSQITYNLVGYYENSWVSARLAYTFRSHYFVGLDRSAQENEDNVGQLDGSLNFTVTPKVTISVDGLNLTNQLLKYYAQNKTQVRAVYENGTQVYAGVHVKF